MKISRPLLMATAIVALAACSKKPPQELPPAPGGDSSAQTGAPAAPTGPVKGSQEDFVASVASDRILFGTDQYDVDPRRTSRSCRARPPGCNRTPMSA